MENFLTYDQAREVLGVSRKVIWKLVKDGTLQAHRQGVRRNLYFEQKQVNELLKMRAA